VASKQSPFRSCLTTTKELLPFRNSSIRAKLSLLIAISGTFALLLLSVFVLTYEGYLQKQAASRELLCRPAS